MKVYYTISHIFTIMDSDECIPYFKRHRAYALNLIYLLTTERYTYFEIRFRRHLTIISSMYAHSTAVIHRRVRNRVGFDVHSRNSVIDRDSLS